MSPKLQKQSALKLAGRIIPRAKLRGTIYDTQPIALGYNTRDFNWIYALSGNDVNLILVIRCIHHQDTQILPKANSFTKP